MLLAQPVQLTKTKMSICATASIRTNVLSEDAWKSHNYLSSEHNNWLNRPAPSTDKVGILKNRLLFTSSSRTDRHYSAFIKSSSKQQINADRQTDRQTDGHIHTYATQTHRTVIGQWFLATFKWPTKHDKAAAAKKVADPQGVVGGDQPLPLIPSLSERLEINVPLLSGQSIATVQITDQTTAQRR